MLYEVKDYFLWSLLYSKIEGANYNYQKKVINPNFLYRIYNFSKNKNMNIFRLSKKELEEILDFELEKTKCGSSSKEKILNLFINELSELENKVNEELNICEKEKISYITIESEGYFNRLKEIKHPPFVIFYKGNLPKEEELKNSVALIGTREVDEYGEKVATIMGEVLSENNIWNISGLAVGCDKAGHIGSIKGGGKTGAILGHGLNIPVYPAKNRPLAEKILETGGFLLSELCPSISLSKIFLVERDRLQSALSDGVLVIECGEKSGTLHAIANSMNLKKKVIVWNPIKKNNIDQKLISGNIALLDGEFQKLENSVIKKIKKYNITGIQTKEELLEKVKRTEEKINEEENKLEILKFDNMVLKF